MEFLERHRNTFTWIGGIFGSGYLLVKWATSSFIEQQKLREKEHCSKTNIVKRFDQNMMDIEFVVSSLIPSLNQDLQAKLNLELITSKLQRARAEKLELKESKMDLWEELKIGTFTRTLSAIYLLNLLTVFTTLQLSLLGRSFYLDSIAALNKNDDVERTIAEETERKYLTLSWYLLNVGWKDCVDRVNTAVSKVVEKLSLKTGISFDSLKTTIDEIRNEVEYENGKPVDFQKFLMPEEGQEKCTLAQGGITDDEMEDVQELLDETRDFLESTEFHKVLSSSLDACFNLLAEQNKNIFFGPESQKSSTPNRLDFESGMPNEPETPKQSKILPLAKVLATIAKSIHSVFNGIPNMYQNEILASPKLRAFAVLVYSGWE